LLLGRTEEERDRGVAVKEKTNGILPQYGSHKE